MSSILTGPIMRTLCLNVSYEPLGFLHQQRAVCLVLEKKAEILEFGNNPYRSISGITVLEPVVVRLNKYIKVPRNLSEGISRAALFARDRYTCQYCGTHASQLNRRNKLTVDHILPKSKGGPNHWENVVTSCYFCNLHKRDRTPMEANMKFVHLYKDRAPKKPHLLTFAWGGKLNPKQKKWIEYYYGEDDLEDVG